MRFFSWSEAHKVQSKSLILLLFPGKLLSACRTVLGVIILCMAERKLREDLLSSQKGFVTSSEHKTDKYRLSELTLPIQRTMLIP